MATNRDLLKEAIADAKAVKDTAIANAKAALEEAFTPFLKEKLAAKINEMDEEEVDEVMYDEAEKMDEMKKSEEMEEMDEVSLDELLAELEKEDKDVVKEEAKEEDLSEAKEEEEEEEVSIEDMSEDDLKSFIEDVIKDMVAAGELEAGEETEEEGAEEGAEEVELEMGSEEGEEEIDEEINIDEILAEADEEKEELEEGKGLGVLKGIANMFNPFKQPAEYVKEMEKKLKESPELKNDAEFMGQYKFLKSLSGVSSAAGSFTGGGGSGEKQSRLESKELEEAYKTIETLQTTINEINLLNAKLLYTNKIFRNKSLTESQKIKVLTAFDKASSKKEVELVYETLQESLKVSTTKAPIKESLGSASKALGNASAKQIIEVDNQFARWQHLAGIKK